MFCSVCTVGHSLWGTTGTLATESVNRVSNIVLPQTMKWVVENSLTRTSLFQLEKIRPLCDSAPTFLAVMRQALMTSVSTVQLQSSPG